MAGIFDAFSGSDEAQTAAVQNAAALAQMQAQTNQYYNTYQTQGLGALGDARTQALADWEKGLTGQLGAYGQGISTLQGVGTGPLEQAIGAYQQGQGTAAGGVAGALAAGQGGVNTLQNLGASYTPAVEQYYAALGLKGPEASAAARSAFTNSPGYQYQVDEANKQALAAASKAGMTYSGNTATALLDRSQQMAGSQWQDYLNRLQGFVSPQLQAAQGTANAYGTLGNLGMQGVGAMSPYTSGLAQAYNNLFVGQRGLAGDVSNQYANMAGAYGQNYGARAGTETGYGGDVTNLYGNITQGQAQTIRDVTQGNIASNNAVAAAGAADASNLWGLAGAGVRAAGSAYGGGGARTA